MALGSRMSRRNCIGRKRNSAFAHDHSVIGAIRLNGRRGRIVVATKERRHDRVRLDRRGSGHLPSAATATPAGLAIAPLLAAISLTRCSHRRRRKIYKAATRLVGLGYKRAPIRRERGSARGALLIGAAAAGGRLSRPRDCQSSCHPPQKVAQTRMVQLPISRTSSTRRWHREKGDRQMSELALCGAMVRRYLREPRRLRSNGRGGGTFSAVNPRALTDCWVSP